MAEHFLTSKPSGAGRTGCRPEGTAKAELLTRANIWGKAHGYKPLTTASLLEWRQQGLVPSPRGRALGRGKGSTQLWSWQAYRRVLQVMRLRALGIHSHREQRLTLWFDGADLELHVVRLDLHSYLRDFLEALRWEFIRANDDLTQVPPEANRTFRRFTNPGGTRLFIKRRGLALDGPAWTFLRQYVTRPETRDMLRLVGLTLFYPKGAADDVVGTLSALPVGFSQFFFNDRQMQAWKGLFSHPEDRPHALLDGLRNATDRTVLNLRDFVRGSNELWDAGLQTLQAMVKSQPELVATLGPWGAALPSIFGWLATVRPVNSLELRIGLIAMLLGRVENGRDQAEPFGEAGRIGARALRAALPRRELTA